MMDKMDVYAHVLVAQGHEAELNRLCASLMAIDRGRVETWLALARYTRHRTVLRPNLPLLPPAETRP